MSNGDALDYKVEIYPKGNSLIDVMIHKETQEVWVTEKQIAELFDLTTQTVAHHIANIYKEDELDPASTTRHLLVVRNEGNRAVSRRITHYSMDVINFIGFRVSAKRAVEFRQWASEIIKSYVRDGFVLNEKALRDSPEKVNELAAKIRALRSEEIHVYDRVKLCFKESASDYDKDSQEVRTFYARMQDKFHYAITGMVGARLILDRANHEDDNMGLNNFKGTSPTLADAKVGKNYLRENELYRMHLLSEQFLLYAESTTLQGKKMTMKSLNEHIDKLLVFNEYVLLTEYPDGYIKDEAMDHATTQFNLLKKKKIIEKAGYIYDVELLAMGEFDFLFEK
ncbi:TPA: virulence RhuM family protein [Yersinia enterocolitica]|nr:virulence RhuM family protein [Yersinia enterocolitica]ELI8281221.1 virulence RhuM family protein [Yersinia enterocolitica]HDL8228889.1 virulence RhuM family protein [Yersinia enterocolitica]HDL8426266.1 virulence RhuM family protein [Yersinia enterocolitica]HDM9013931.1 virulence RhuM family protein [Yersinia enterocolitica]